MRKNIFAALLAVLSAALAGCASKSEPPFMPNYLSRAAAGDWARYSDVASGLASVNYTGKLKVTVVSTGGGEVTLEETYENKGVTLRRRVDASGNMYNIIFSNLCKETTDAKAKGFEGPVSETVTAAGREFDCSRYTLKFTGKAQDGSGREFGFTEIWWLSEKAPLDGMVRMKRISSEKQLDRTNEITQERALLEYGSGAQKPVSGANVPEKKPDAGIGQIQPAPASPIRVPNLLVNATKGDWAEYDVIISISTAADCSTATLRREVRELRPDSVVLTIVDGVSGRTYDLVASKAADPVEEIKRQFAGEVPGIAFVNSSSAAETVEASGKKWTTTCYTLDFMAPSPPDAAKGATVRICWWISQDAPLDGTVKKILIFSIPSRDSRMQPVRMTQEYTLKAHGRSE